MINNKNIQENVFSDGLQILLDYSEINIFTKMI